jgi:5-methylcytosine-specific restriction endonuclease McrA
MALKRCTVCGPQPVENFTKRKASPDGLGYKCKTCTRDYLVAWRKANYTHVLEYARQYKIDNAAAVVEYRNRHDVKERDSIRHAEWAKMNQERRRANAEYVHPLVVLECHDGICGICGSDVDPLNFHMDHVIPLSRGGEHNYTNVQPAHPFCNISKRDGRGASS